MTRLYHYTSGFGLACAVSDGRLRPFPKASAPGIWFTESESWDPTACDPIEQLFGEDWGRWRIVADERSMDLSFEEYRLSDESDAKLLEGIALGRGSCPSLWWIRLKKLAFFDWRGVERLCPDGKWRSAQTTGLVHAYRICKERL